MPFLRIWRIKTRMGLNENEEYPSWRCTERGRIKMRRRIPERQLCDRLPCQLGHQQQQMRQDSQDLRHNNYHVQQLFSFEGKIPCPSFLVASCRQGQFPAGQHLKGGRPREAEKIRQKTLTMNCTIIHWSSVTDTWMVWTTSAGLTEVCIKPRQCFSCKSKKSFTKAWVITG